MTKFKCKEYGFTICTTMNLLGLILSLIGLLTHHTLGRSYCILTANGVQKREPTFLQGNFFPDRLPESNSASRGRSDRSPHHVARLLFFLLFPFSETTCRPHSPSLLSRVRHFVPRSDWSPADRNWPMGGRRHTTRHAVPGRGRRRRFPNRHGRFCDKKNILTGHKIKFYENI